MDDSQLDLFSAGSEGLTLVSSEPECESSGSASPTNSANGSSPDTGPLSPATTTFALSEVKPYLQSMSSVEGSPARTSALLAEERESTGSGRVFGRSSLVLLASLNPDTCSWRTSQLSLLEEWAEFSQTWPRAGMTRNGIAYPLAPLVPLTRETESGSWPTPTASDAARGAGSSPVRTAGHGGGNLRMAVKWRTPSASDATGGPADPRKRLENGHALNLKEQVWIGGGGGSLNPAWVEWLLGFPIGWTELGRLATVLFHKSPNG